MVVSAIVSPREIVDNTAQQIKAHPEAFLGPWFFSLIALTFMMGVLATQITKYFSTFGYESPRLFWLVVSCVVLVVAEWVALLSIEWNGYGDWSRFLQTSRQTLALPITTWLTVFAAQLFFASRCYTLYGRNKLIFGALLFGK
ncbi:hypothetical protein M407DRAFT_22178 [Tulasnella calospora MUT 4182]|uniref:Uncharacterized protein n=1 Tax=Tulasnella calospora MUT 4182 TaxID=1051891 RepID=A0A0C3QNE5_9AGAM|nr:hypothetical protein M407DRAFT_22178 [Tulasnella calospora MUT 4182]